MIRFLCFAGLLGLLCLFTSAQAAEGKKEGKPDPEEIFKKIDSNGDGKVSKEEFGKFIEQMKEKFGKGGGDGKVGEHLDKLFDMLDTDKDGFLSLEEFKKMREVMEKFRQKKSENK